MVTSQAEEEAQPAQSPPTEAAVSPDEPGSPTKPVTLWNIIREFGWIGATSLGQGRQAYFYSAFVRRYGWLTNEEFADGLSLSQIVPGPNLSNFSVYIGWLRAGWKGALLAWFSLLTPGFLAILAAAWILSSGQLPPIFQGALAGVAAVSVALLVMVVVQTSPAACRRARGGWAILAATFVLAGPLAPVLHLGTVPILVIMTTVSLVVNRPR